MSDITVSGLLQEIETEMCDNYCKYPEICRKEQPERAEDLLFEKYCANCPLNKL